MESDKDSKKSDYTPSLAIFEDIPQINSIIVSFWGKNSIYTNQYYYQCLKKDLSYVYKIDNEVIAVCLVDYKEKYKDISIDLICVKEAYQGNGLGKSLLEFCINNCVKKGYYDFYLHVATTNTKAIKLYKKLGFVIDKYVKDYYHLDKPPDRDAYLMRLIKRKDSNINFKKNLIHSRQKSHSDKINYNNYAKKYFYNQYHQKNDDMEIENNNDDIDDDKYNNNHNKNDKNSNHEHNNLEQNNYEHNNYEYNKYNKYYDNNNYYYNNFYHNNNYYNNYYRNNYNNRNIYYKNNYNFQNYRDDYWNRYYRHYK